MVTVVFSNQLYIHTAAYCFFKEINMVNEATLDVSRLLYYLTEAKGIEKFNEFLIFILQQTNIQVSTYDCCFLSINQVPKSTPALMVCEVTISLVDRLSHFLSEANLLSQGNLIECFLYKFYKFNSVENLSLVILWDFMYKARFTPEKYVASGFFSYLYHKLIWIQLLAPNLKLGCISLANALLNNNVVRHHNSDI